MGEGILRFYKTKVRKEYKIAFISTFLIALLIHIYKFTNTLPNHDSLYNYYSDQNVLGSGRWALQYACGISSYYDLPWINGLLSCIFIALTVVIIIAIFKLKNPILIGMAGALFAASPATTETLFFLFTADGYMLAMLLAAVAVRLSVIEETRILRLIMSCVCICVACGIYQAYVSFALLLAVCYFIDVLLQEKHNKKDCFKWVLRQAVIFAVALAAYYVIWKLCMHISNTTANDYQGISKVGSISPGMIIQGFKKSIRSTMLYFLQWDVLAHGFTLYSILSIVFLLIMAVGLVIACAKSGIWKRKWAFLLLILCLAAIMPFACIWHFVSGEVGYRPMMLQCLTLLFVLTAVLYERWAKTAAKNAVCLLLTLIVFNNALMANICYFYMNLCYERSYAAAVEMMGRIHELDDEYDFDRIAVLGNLRQEVDIKTADEESGEMRIPGRIHMLSSLLEENLLYDSDHTTKFLKATFGLDLDSLTRSERDALLDTDEVQNMGCWPSGDSVAVIDDTLVIKLSDKKEAE